MTPATAIALSGMTAATLKLNASASNLANADESGPAPGGGVAQAVTTGPVSLIAYDPTSPLAGVRGMIDTPDIDPVAEVSNQLAAGNAFAFSLKALKAANDQQQTLLDLTT